MAALVTPIRCPVCRERWHLGPCGTPPIDITKYRTLRYPDRKVCSACHGPKSLTEYARSRQSRDGLQAYCNPCHRKVRDARRAAMTLEERAYLGRLRAEKRRARLYGNGRRVA